MLCPMKTLRGKKRAAARNFLESWAIQDFPEEIARVMEAQKITKTELARRLKVAPSWVTKFFQGENLTLRTLVRVAFAVGFRVDLKLMPYGEW